MRVGLILLLALPVLAESPGKKPPKQEELPELRQLRERYGIRIVVQRTAYRRITLHGTLCYEQPGAIALKRFAKLLRDEFSIYPPAFIKRSGLRQIVLCSKLTFGGQTRSALPDRARAALVYDVGAGLTRPDYVRHVIHHEFFHIVDWSGRSWTWRIPEWIRSNAKGFKYGKGGKSLQHDTGSWDPKTGNDGFLNRYSRSSVAEDMAEVYAFLVTRPKLVATRTKTDAVLKVKVQLMKRHLQWYSPTMSEEFWKRAAGARGVAIAKVASPPEPEQSAGK